MITVKNFPPQHQGYFFQTTSLASHKKESHSLKSSTQQFTTVAIHNIAIKILEGFQGKTTDELLSIGDRIRYSPTLGGTENYGIAAIFYYCAAARGNTLAMRQLAYLYEIGLGIEQNLENALELYVRAALNDDDEALIRLGDIYRIGRGVEKNEEVAAQLCIQAAEHGNQEAVDLLENSASWSHTAQRSSLKLLESTILAASLGDTEAQIRLGNAYRDGNGVKKCIPSALYWYKQAASLGNVNAMVCVAHIYKEHSNQIPYEKKAAKWFLRAAEHGNIAAEEILANPSLWSPGIQRSSDDLTHLYEMYAADGDTAAMMRLGNMYFEGTGVQQSYREAVNWFLRAAECGNLEAEDILLNESLWTNSLMNTRKELLHLYRLASAQGNAHARVRIEKISQKKLQKLQTIPSAL
jgi:TPR repeat protein